MSRYCNLTLFSDLVTTQQPITVFDIVRETVHGEWGVPIFRESLKSNAIFYFYPPSETKSIAFDLKF